MHLKILLFTITPQIFLFASDTKSCRQACEKAEPLFAKTNVSEHFVLMYLVLIFWVFWVYGVGVFLVWWGFFPSQ